MDRDLAKYEAYKKFIETMVYRAGVWPHCEDKISLYRLIIVVGLCVSNTVGAKILGFAYSSFGNVSLFVQSIQNIVAIYSPILRLVLYLRYRKELVFLDKELGAKFKEELKSEENRPAMLKNISLYTKFMHVFNVSTGLAIILYWLPIAILNLKYKKSVQVMPGKYPFAVEPRSPLHWAIFVFESTMFWFSFHTMAGVDSGFGLHCFRISGLIRRDAERIASLNPDDPRARERLQECVTTHQMIIRAKLALQKAYGVIIVWSYLINSLVMCSLLWQSDKMKHQLTVPKLIYFGSYIVLKLVQTFIYAYYGSTVTLESENYQDAIYTSNWPGSGNVPLMKDLFFMLLQRPVTLKACGFFLVTMQFFEKICSTTISYFFLIQSIEVIILTVHRKDLLVLNNGVSAHFEKDLEKPESRPHLLAHYRAFSKFFYTFYYSVALNISMMVISPLLALRHGKYIRAYPQLPPFSYEPGGTVHWIIYVFEALSGYYCFSITVGVDSVFGYYALHLVGELRLLAARFQNLKPGENYKKELKECVDRHVVLIKAKFIIERIFGFLSMWLAVTCAIVMCAIIFQCTEMQTKNVTAYRAIYLLCYCFLKLVQAYSYAWFGNIISVESKRCFDAIYNADWASSGDLRHMNDVLIIQSQNPMIFKAKSVMIVQLDMYMKVVKASVSYFCLLQTLDENQE